MNLATNSSILKYCHYGLIILGNPQSECRSAEANLVDDPNRFNFSWVIFPRADHHSELNPRLKYQVYSPLLNSPDDRYFQNSRHNGWHQSLFNDSSFPENFDRLRERICDGPDDRTIRNRKTGKLMELPVQRSLGAKNGRSKAIADIAFSDDCNSPRKNRYFISMTATQTPIVALSPLANFGRTTPAGMGDLFHGFGGDRCEGNRSVRDHRVNRPSKSHSSGGNREMGKIRKTLQTTVSNPQDF
jgi:hypothetical protein